MNKLLNYKYCIIKRYFSQIFIANSPVYIFHHIPKCGGSSILKVLEKWFILEKDYRADWKTGFPQKKNITKYKSCHCLAGHYDMNGNHIEQRYPEIKNNKTRFKIFTFVRDPLEIKTSLHYFEKKNNVSNNSLLIDTLFDERKNYMAGIFPCNEINYKEIIDRYFFVGFIENAQNCMDRLAEIIGKKKVMMPIANVTKRNEEYEKISEETIEKFKKENKVDYLIYKYCKEKFAHVMENGSNT